MFRFTPTHTPPLLPTLHRPSLEIGSDLLCSPSKNLKIWFSLFTAKNTMKKSACEKKHKWTCHMYLDADRPQ